MNKILIDRFFTELEHEFGAPAEIIVTGAAAGSLLGHSRPSLDIDFEIRLLKDTGSVQKRALSDAIQKAALKVGVGVNYSEDVSRWSLIDYLDYRRAALRYKTIGKLQIRMMSPEHWTIGKMTRFLEMDREDLLQIIKKRKLKVENLILLWGRALRSSPLSLVSGQFRDHVFDFLKHDGRKVWGKTFDAEQAIALFQRAAGIK